MAITYREGHDGKLSISEMDGNFHYIEDNIDNLNTSVGSLEVLTDDLVMDVAGLTGSITTLTTGLAGATGSITTLSGFTTHIDGATFSGLTTSVAGVITYSEVLGGEIDTLTTGLATLTGFNTSISGVTYSTLTASVAKLVSIVPTTTITRDFRFIVLSSTGVTQSATFSFTNGILATHSFIA